MWLPKSMVLPYGAETLQTLEEDLEETKATTILEAAKSVFDEAGQGDRERAVYRGRIGYRIQPPMIQLLQSSMKALMGREILLGRNPTKANRKN